MTELLLKNMNPIKVLVFISFFFGFFFLDRKDKKQRLFLYVLVCGLLTEYGVFPFLYFNKPIGALYSISFIIHNLLWLCLLDTVYKPFKYFLQIRIVYVFFSVVNFLFLEGMNEIDNFTFIIGALLYLVVFVYISYVELKKENISFFVSNDYLLLFIPVLLFIGLSMMFGFMNYGLFNEYIFRDYGLYDFICHLSDLNYYLLAMLYIFRIKKIFKK